MHKSRVKNGGFFPWTLQPLYNGLSFDSTGAFFNRTMSKKNSLQILVKMRARLLYGIHTAGTLILNSWKVHGNFSKIHGKRSEWQPGITRYGGLTAMTHHAYSFVIPIRI